MSIAEPERLDLPGADVRIWRGWLEQPQECFDALGAELDWRRRTIRMFGRDIAEPRLTAWHGDSAAHYRYSGRDNQPEPWTPTLLRLRERVQQTVGGPFNSVLANLYRDGSDHLGWHSDDEPELGPHPTIASVSLGAGRRMQFRTRPKGSVALSVELPSGSLLVMSGETQQRYHHRIPGTSRPVGPRINLTFRRIGTRPASVSM